MNPHQCKLVGVLFLGVWLPESGRHKHLSEITEKSSYKSGADKRPISRGALGKYLFASPFNSKDAPYGPVTRVWHRIGKLAVVETLRIHDLRHSFASFLVSGGRSLYEVQQILGHSDPKITMRYAHLSSEALRDAANVAFSRRYSFHLER